MEDGRSAKYLWTRSLSTLSLSEGAARKSSPFSTLCPDQPASSMMTRKMAAADFTTLKCLGKVSYGTVHLVKQHSAKRLSAQDQFCKASLTVHKKLVEQTETERSILESPSFHCQPLLRLPGLREALPDLGVRSRW